MGCVHVGASRADHIGGGPEQRTGGLWAICLCQRRRLALLRRSGRSAKLPQGARWGAHLGQGAGVPAGAFFRAGAVGDNALVGVSRATAPHAGPLPSICEANLVDRQRASARDGRQGRPRLFHHFIGAAGESIVAP
jgi:hypothetical protein